MALDARGQLRKDVMQAEGCRLKPYKDTAGKLTIGYGRNLDDVGISQLEAEVLLEHDLASAEAACVKAFAWFADLNDARQRVVVELVFNAGLGTFQKFEKTIAAIVLHDWAKAAAEILHSKAAKDAPLRFGRLAMTMRNG